MTDSIKYQLEEKDIPENWYNIVADLPETPSPVIHPGTGMEITGVDLAPLFPEAIIQQEVSRERYIEIPEPVRDILCQWRPAPLYRARRLEKALDTPAKIYYKYEGVSPAGSHKLNTAVAQAYYSHAEGVKRITTETGAGQWGSSLSLAGSMFGLDIEVFMVKISFNQKPYRRAFMESFGASCVASPSEMTEAGRSILAADPESTGSLGMAISEAVELAAQREDTKYALGSVLNHVLLHQTVIGQEAIKQMEMAGDYPDIVIGCTGGGSNFAGLVFPFLGNKFRDGKEVKVIAAEPANCPTLTKGRYAYDFGDTASLTPLMKMHTLGSRFVPPGFHAGGLRYHGMAPLVSQVTDIGAVSPRSFKQSTCFEAGLQFARAEGILPAPETNHAIAAVFEEAERCKQEDSRENILFCLSGHGNFDMQAYMDYFDGKLQDNDINEAELDNSLAELPSVINA